MTEPPRQARGAGPPPSLALQQDRCSEPGDGPALLHAPARRHRNRRVTLPRPYGRICRIADVAPSHTHAPFGIPICGPVDLVTFRRIVAAHIQRILPNICLSVEMPEIMRPGSDWPVMRALYPVQLWVSAGSGLTGGQGFKSAQTGNVLISAAGRPRRRRRRVSQARAAVVPSTGTGWALAHNAACRVLRKAAAARQSHPGSASSASDRSFPAAAAGILGFRHEQDGPVTTETLSGMLMPRPAA